MSDFKIVKLVDPIIVQTNGVNASIGGNTDGTPALISSGTMLLAGGNNITLSQSQNTISIVGGAGGPGGGVAQAAGTQTATSGTVNFADSNGVTFGMSGSNQITASVRTNYQSSGNYLTTARASNDAIGLNTAKTNATWTVNSSGFSFDGGAYLTTAQPVGAYLTTARASNDAVGLNTAKTNVTWTVNSSGISLDGGAYLTTAMASNRGTDFVQANAVFNGTNASGTIASNAISISVAAPGGGGGPALKGSGAQTQSTGTVEFANSNGITFGLSNNGTMTASHNGLTTARASNDAVGLNTAQTNVTWTVNSSGISLNAGAYLTTAAQSSASNVSGVIAGTASNAATNQSAQLSGGVSFSNTNGISFFTTASGAVSGLAATVKTDYQSSNANYLTSQSNQALSGSNGAFTFQTATFGNLNGMSFYSSNGSMVGSYTVPNVPAQTNQTIGIYGSSQTTGQSSSSTYDARSLTFRGAGNISVGNSGGEVIISATGGAGVTPVVSNSAGSFSFTTLNFSNANNVTWGTSAGSIVTASVAAPGAAAENNWFALTGANTAGNTTASGSTIGLSGINLTLSGTNGSAINISAPATSSLSATGQVSLSTNGSTISIGVPAQITHSRYNEFKESPLVGGEIGQASLHIQPWLIPNLQYDRVVVHKLFSNATNSSFSFTVSDWVGIYTRTGNSLSLLQSVSANTNFSGSGTAGSYLSYGGGIKAITMGMTNTLTEGMYWLGVVQRTTTGGGAGHTLQQALNSNINSTYRGLMGVATNATNQMSLGFGVYTVSTSGMPGSIAFTEINGNSSIFRRPPSVYLVSGTV